MKVIIIFSRVLVKKWFWCKSKSKNQLVRFFGFYFWDIFVIQYLVQQLYSVFTWDFCNIPLFHCAKKSRYYLERSYLETPFCMYVINNGCTSGKLNASVNSGRLPGHSLYFASYTCNEEMLLCIIDSMELNTSDRIAAVSVCAWLVLMQRLISIWTYTNMSIEMSYVIEMSCLSVLELSCFNPWFYLWKCS